MTYYGSYTALCRTRVERGDEEDGHDPALSDLIVRLRDMDAAGRPLSEALELAESFFHSLGGDRSNGDNTITRELSTLAHQIQRTRQELSALQANTIKDKRIPEAGDELTAVVQHTEEATATIMAATEELMAADSSAPDFPELLNDRVMQIFEACSFQDITGQRVTKVAKALSYIEARVERLIEALGVDDSEHLTDDEIAAAERDEELILHGPQHDGEAHSQDEVDALFDQNDIDALFD